MEQVELSVHDGELASRNCHVVRDICDRAITNKNLRLQRTAVSRRTANRLELLAGDFGVELATRAQARQPSRIKHCIIRTLCA